MDKHAFKQRIIGAIVLVALAVIFIPILLPGHRDLGFSDTESYIPPKPDELENLKVLELEKPLPAPAPREIVRTPIDERSPPAPKTESELPAVEQKPTTEDKKPGKNVPDNSTGDTDEPIDERRRALIRAGWSVPVSIVRFFSVYGPGLCKQLLWDACGKRYERFAGGSSRHRCGRVLVE